jgi:hypothetical protein
MVSEFVEMSNVITRLLAPVWAPYETQAGHACWQATANGLLAFSCVLPLILNGHAVSAAMMFIVLFFAFALLHNLMMRWHRRPINGDWFMSGTTAPTFLFGTLMLRMVLALGIAVPLALTL